MVLAVSRVRLSAPPGVAYGGYGLIAAGMVVWALLVVAPVGAEGNFVPSSVKKGVLLVASPTLGDPNFRETVVLIIEHGEEGTLGVIVNRPTGVLLTEVLPDIAALKGTTYRLFAGGPVQPTQLLVLFRLKEPSAEARSVFDGVYVGGTPTMLERVIKQPKPTETFRAFAGSAGWAPGQLAYEMNQGAWATLPPDSAGLFDRDPSTFWQDCIDRLQAPRGIAY
ncbi:MAG: YqgE/AlgH family protein [Nitrospira sp.]|nr:YqgE/AlgH family protein [Nitrospira sp.]